MRSLLIGNYGVGNLGDEALKDYFLSAFPEVEWTVLSAHPTAGQLHRLPAGLRSFFTTPWFKTLKAIRRSDAVVFGGGSLFTETESTLACVLWFIHAFAAWVLRTPYCLAFQGVGPFKTGVGKALSRWAFRHASFVSVRDAFSEEQTKEFPMHTKVVRTFDPIILSVHRDDSEGVKNEIILIPRFNARQAFFDAAREVLAAYPTAAVTIVTMQPDDHDEDQICQELVRMSGGKGVIRPVTSMSELTKAMSAASLVVSARYHGGLAALACRAPLTAVAQAKNDKLSSLVPYATGETSIDDAIRDAKQGEHALQDALRRIAGTL